MLEISADGVGHCYASGAADGVGCRKLVYQGDGPVDSPSRPIRVGAGPSSAWVETQGRSSFFFGTLPPAPTGSEQPFCVGVPCRFAAEWPVRSVSFGSNSVSVVKECFATPEPRQCYPDQALPCGLYVLGAQKDHLSEEDVNMGANSTFSQYLMVFDTDMGEMAGSLYPSKLDNSEGMGDTIFAVGGLLFHWQGSSSAVLETTSIETGARKVLSRTCCDGANDGADSWITAPLVLPNNAIGALSTNGSGTSQIALFTPAGPVAPPTETINASFSGFAKVDSTVWGFSSTSVAALPIDMETYNWNTTATVNCTLTESESELMGIASVAQEPWTKDIWVVAITNTSRALGKVVVSESACEIAAVKDFPNADFLDVATNTTIPAITSITFV